VARNDDVLLPHSATPTDTSGAVGNDTLFAVGGLQPCQYLRMPVERLGRTVGEYGTGASVRSLARIRTRGRHGHCLRPSSSIEIRGSVRRPRSGLREGATGRSARRHLCNGSVGHGTNSDERRSWNRQQRAEGPGRQVVAVEPSKVMIEQRPPRVAPAVRAVAEALPLATRSCDAR
jgi:hypothetical protein